MMKKTLLVLTIAGGVALTAGLLATPAQAGVHISVGTVGTAFSVGGLGFNLVFGAPYGGYGNHGYGYDDAYYYSTPRDIRYRGYQCHGGCAYDAGQYYHHRNCPTIAHHFRRHGFRPLVDLAYALRPFERFWRHYDGYRYFRGNYDRYRHYGRKYDRYRHNYNRYRHNYDRYRHKYDRYRPRFRDNDWDSDSDRWDRRRWKKGRDLLDKGRRFNDRRRGSAFDTRSRRR